MDVPDKWGEKMRLIDADALRETIEFCHYFGNDGTTFNASEKEALMQIIDVAPTIDAVPRDFHNKTCEAMAKRHLEELEKYRWIPCSEKLPSEDGWYLIALAFEWGIEYEAGRWEDGMWWNPNSHVNVAWMPLPKSYEETDHE